MKQKLVRWHKIENSYRQENIAWWLGQFPELAHETYVILEKIHGSNWQWYFTPHQPLQAASRNQFLDTNGSFQGAVIADLAAAHATLLARIQQEVNATGNTMRLFGELCGPGIQSGVYYSEKKHVLYFGAMVNDELLPFAETEALLNHNTALLIPILGVTESLEAALTVDTEFDSLVPIPQRSDNICEGVVIQPYSHVYKSHLGSVFMLKKKNEKFAEITPKEKKKTPPSDRIAQLYTDFLAYITDQRLQSIFSQHGEIETPAQIGDYIRLLITDAQEEFARDYDVADLDKKQRKYVYNVGRIIVAMLKQYL